MTNFTTTSQENLNNVVTNTPLANQITTGSAGNDYFSGTLEDDFYDGGAGSDYIAGYAGNDSLLGGIGDDSMTGSTGNNTIDGGDGNDNIAIDNGNDLVFAGNGNDSIIVYSGNATVDGGEGGDSLHCYAYQTDVNAKTGLAIIDGGRFSVQFNNIENFIGSFGNDKIVLHDKGGNITASIGNDTLLGGNGNDILLGEDGNDQLFGGAGDDSLDGGHSYSYNKNDIAIYNGNFADYNFGFDNKKLTITDINLENGNEGTDILANIATLKFADKEINLVNGLNYIASYSDLIKYYGADEVAGVFHHLKYGFHEGRVESFDPKVYLNKNPDVRANVYDDNAATLHYINIGYAQGKNASLSSADLIIGTSNGDNITGYGGNDTIDGGDGSYGYDSANYLGYFEDYSFTVENSVITIKDNSLRNGDDGIDKLTNFEFINFSNKIISIPSGFTYMAANPDLIASFKGNADVALQHYLQIGINAGKSIFFNANIYLNKYPDLKLAFKDDVVAAATHFVQTGYAEGRSASENSEDNIVGTSGSDYIEVYSGNDTVAGNDGQDTIYGGHGNDILFGGEGNDRIFDEYGDDSVDGGAGNDAIGGYIYYPNNNGSDTLLGGDGDDYIYGSHGGKDILLGGEGNDTVRGLGDAYLDGGNGNDDLYIGVGSNTVVGGTGNDTLVLSVNYDGNFTDVNLKTGFVKHSTDVNLNFQISGVENVKFNNETYYFYNVNYKITLSDIAGEAVGYNWNDTLIGGDGNDSLTGGAGNDQLDGGAGVDMAVYSGNFNAYGFSINDNTLVVSQNNESDTLKNIEKIRFSDRDINMVDGLSYIAANPELIATLGANANAGLLHYLQTGWIENKNADFDVNTYIAKYADVRAAYGSDAQAAISHYINIGYGDGRNVSLSNADNLRGTTGNDNIFSFGGNDTISGLDGNDKLDGGAGADTAHYRGQFADYQLSYSNGTIQVVDVNLANGDEGTDLLTNIETLQFVNKDLSLPDGLRYIASYGGLINAFKADANAGINHYLYAGFAEGRTVTFNAEQYLAKYADVRAYAGTDLDQATRHFILTGHGLGRTNERDQFVGTSGNDTLQGFDGNDSIDGGAGIDRAVYSGKLADYIFASSSGVLSISDNVLADGNEGKDNLKNVEILTFADVDVAIVNGLRYIASYGDLINAYGENVDAGISHYLRFGVKEGRTVTFDPEVYLNKYADLRAAKGNDLDAATAHYIQYGFKVGRNVSLTSNDNLFGTTGNDSIKGYGGNDTIDAGTGVDRAMYSGNSAGFSFSVSSGVIQITDTNLADGNEGLDRLSNFEVLQFANKDINVVDGLRYIASNPSLIQSVGNNADLGLAHYLNTGVNQGLLANFDAETYLAKYADLRAHYGTDTKAAMMHFINNGFKEGRNTSLSGSDSLLGSSLADILDAGTGNDNLTGALGADIFKFSAASGQDVISDFSKAQGDKISIALNVNGSGIVDAASALARVSGALNAVIDLGGGNTITLTGVAANSFTAADFVFV